ncbi:MAG: hypothetical protein EP297_00735 [Gammaproteobacteria bacterium]|nr:MAG: hypothetical protein EP297_00735 [Gammaproteobacteria bacterium]
MLTNARLSFPLPDARLSAGQYQRPGHDQNKQTKLVPRLLLVSSLVFMPNFAWSAFLNNVMLSDLKSKYGERAHKRGVYLQELLAKLKNADTRTKLKEVNDFFNKFSYKSDLELWGEKDYWATPTEFVGRYGGDCEDYVISKYLTLRSLGIPDDKLRLTYAKSTKQNIAHMVLNYFETPKSVPLVLGNYNPKLLPANQRKDLKLLYSFNLSASRS